MAAMKGLLSAVRRHLWLLLGQLWATLQLWAPLHLTAQSLRQALGMAALPWVELACGTVAVLMVKRRHIHRRGKELSDWCSAYQEVPAERRLSTGPGTPAEEALRSSPVEAEPPKLQVLCLLTLNNTLLHFKSGAAHFWEEAGKWEPLDPSQVTGTGSVLEWPKEKENHRKKGKERFSQTAHVLEEETERWKPSAPERKEEGGRSDLSKAPTEQLTQDSLSQSKAGAGNLLIDIAFPDLPGGQGYAGEELKRAEGNASHSIYPSDVDLRCVIDEGDVHVSCDRQDNGEMAGQLRQGTAIIEELTAQIQRLQTEQRCLHLENAQLDSDNENIELRLQTLPKLHGDHMTKLMREANDEEERCSELDGDLSKVTADRACTEKVRNFHRKVVADVKRELEATTSSCREHLRFYEKRLQDSWSAAMLAERKLTELRAENEHTRRLLADVEFGVQPSPSRPFVPAAPPAAHGGPEVPGRPLGHQVPLNGGHPLRA